MSTPEQSMPEALHFGSCPINPPYYRVCPVCSDGFLANDPRAVYCSARCANLTAYYRRRIRAGKAVRPDAQAHGLRAERALSLARKEPPA